MSSNKKAKPNHKQVAFSEEILETTKQISNSLNDFCKNHTFQGFDVSLDQPEHCMSNVCRKIRELLPTSNCSNLLKHAQANGWIAILLKWLNLEQSPALQMESLLVITNIAEVCAHWNTLDDWKFQSPFPPLSFKQTLSKEALQAFDASLLNTQHHTNANANLLHNALQQQQQQQNASTGLGVGFLPPPTPVADPCGSLSFPQILSASCQHLLLRHADAVPTLIDLLSHGDNSVYEQALWILGSMASTDNSSSSSGTGGGGGTATGNSSSSDKHTARDVILACGALKQLLTCLESHPMNLSLQRIGSWTLSNLLDGIFQSANNKKTDVNAVELVDMTVLLPTLRRLLNMTDSEVLSYTCWCLSHLCDSAIHIAGVVTTSELHKLPEGGLVPRLVELLVHPSYRVTKPALRTIGNIVCAECSDDPLVHGTDYTEVILECDAVPRLKELITHSNREIQKEACWTLSNISAGTVDQIQSVIDSGAIPPLVKLVQEKKTDQEVRSEACWVVLNATSCGSDSQIEVLVDEGCVNVLGVLLTEASMVMMALEGLERVLQVEETREMIRREQVENGEVEEEDRPPTLVSAALIESARESHSNGAVTRRADRIWKQHFVSCALCKRSFSRHRTADASFCEECKCHVCSDCNCTIYHLDYQESLWAETEENDKSKKSAKSKKNKKKKEKQKQKKAKQSQEDSESKDKPEPPKEEKKDPVKEEEPKKDDRSPSPVEETEEHDHQIDLVLYLQQTGSIIALSKLMDALEDGGEDYDEELDDFERKMIREQQVLRGQATN